MKKDIILFIGIFLVLLLLAGGTYAYWSWGSDADKSVVFNTVSDIDDYVVYDAGDSHFVGDFQPYDSFCESINTTVSIYKTDEVKDIKLTATIYMDINAIGSNIAASDSVYWVVTRGDNTIGCDDGLSSTSVINYGTFEGKSAGDTFALTDNVELIITRPVREYTVWIWIDNSVEEDELSLLTGETIDTNIWTQIDMYDNVDTATRPELVGEAYAVYSADDTSLRFYRSETPIEVGSTYNGLTVTAVYTGFEDETYEILEAPWIKGVGTIYSKVTSIVFEDEIVPISTAGWFINFSKCSNIDVTRLNTSYVNNMLSMFALAGKNSIELNIIGLDNFDVSSVANMQSMFNMLGTNATILNIGDISGWDVSNVLDMSNMFSSAGENAMTFNIGDISGWDVSKVTDMERMFEKTGNNASYMLDLSGWSVSNVDYWGGFNYGVTTKIISPLWNTGNLYGYAVYSEDDTSLRFYDSNNTINVGNKFNNLTVTKTYPLYDNINYTSFLSVPWYMDYSSVITNVVIEDEIMPKNISNWFATLYYLVSIDVTKLNTSKVTNMKDVFSNAGRDAASFSIIGLESWDTSKVTTMESMFEDMGQKTATMSLDLSNWDTSNVTNMSRMFTYVGYNSSTVSLNLSGWDVSNVTDMSDMFQLSGRYSTTFNITGLENWDTSKVTTMESMFSNAGQSASYTLDLRSWNVCKVTEYNSFNYSVSSKIKSPSWGMECPTS